MHMLNMSCEIGSECESLTTSVTNMAISRLLGGTWRTRPSRGATFSTGRYSVLCAGSRLSAGLLPVGTEVLIPVVQWGEGWLQL